MRKDFLTIKNNVCKEVYDTSTNMLTLIDNYVNIRYRDILTRANINFYNYDYTITTVSGQKDYPLPEDFGKCIGAMDSTNSQQLSELSSLEQLYRNNAADINASGYPTHYVMFESPVMVQPSAASVITVVSSSSNDTTQKILVRGIVSNRETTEEVTLNGVTSASTTLQFTRIKGLSKDGNAVGNVTITAGANTLAILSPKVLISRYKIARMWNTPNSALTISFPYMMSFMPLVEDHDYPLIEIEDILEIGAKAMAHGYQRREATANKYESIYESMIANYLWTRENNPNRLPQFQPTPYSRNTVGSTGRLDANNS